MLALIERLSGDERDAMLEAVAGCWQALQRLGPAIQRDPSIPGSGGGDRRTFRAACLGGDFGLPSAIHLDLLREWNLDCRPPWADTDLRRKLRDAERSRRAEIGSRLPARCREALASVRHQPGQHVGPPPTHTGPLYPPVGEVEHVWTSCTGPVTDDAAAMTRHYLGERGIDPVTVAELDLARDLTLGRSVPNWACYRGAKLTHTAYRLVAPLFDADGAMRSLRFRWSDATSNPNGSSKELVPSGYQTRGLVLANRSAIGLMRVAEGADEVWIAEGTPDFLALSVELQKKGRPVPVFGVFSGAWSSGLATKIPQGSRVIIATHRDAPGRKYRDDIARSLSTRCDVREYRWR